MEDSADSPETNDGYPRYVLGVLVLVYVFNFLDRQILSILNENIKADLALSDAQMGFLYGTAFAVFYALFGIPLGKLADVWVRRSLIAAGLAFWSVMTGVSGLARGFGLLAIARIGVGVGEASASPAAYSLLSDYFPPARRATVLGIYSSGIYIGSGLGLAIGGQVVDRWDLAFAATGAPFGLRGWQVAFFLVGTPGLLLAAWVRTLREPERGAMDGIVSRRDPHPFRTFFQELRAVIPPFTLWRVYETAGSGALGLNSGALLVCSLAAAVLTFATGDAAQWIALGIGSYATFSWSQVLAQADPPTAKLLLATPTVRIAALGFSLLAFAGYGIGYWTAPFFMRTHGLSASEVGLYIGLTSAVAGWLGVTAGGLLADRFRRANRNGRLWVGMIAATAPAPFLWAMLSTESATTALWLNVPLTALTPLWIGAGVSTVQDLVLPRMRGTASAVYLLLVTFVGLALGPYAMGKAAVITGDLRIGMAVGAFGWASALLCLLLASRTLAADEAALIDRARAAGEEIEA